MVSRDRPTCPLCGLDREGEVIFYEDPFIRVVRTKDLKGHRERLMVVSKKHQRDVSDRFYDHALEKVEEVGRRVFHYTYKFVIMEKTFGTIRDHWHKVCSDLDPSADDVEQVLGTPWIKVVDVKRWKQ